MGSHNGSIHTTHTPPPLSFYNTFKLLKESAIVAMSMAEEGDGDSFNESNNIYFQLSLLILVTRT
jgi:hypothetical protein